MMERPNALGAFGVSFLKLKGCLSVLVPSVLKVEATIIPPFQSKLPISRFRLIRAEMV